MRKHEELTDPQSCMSRAKDGEMAFVLVGHDAAAPAAIRAWCRRRIDLGKNKPGDAQIAEAMRCAATMEAEYTRDNRIAKLITVATEPICYNCGNMCAEHFGLNGEQYCFADASGYQWQPRIDPDGQVPLWQPCTVCGNSTALACSDCVTDTGKAVHVCGKAECRSAHDLTCTRSSAL